MPVSKIMYKGKEILYINHENCKEDAMIKNLEEAEKIIFDDNKPHLQLINGINSYATPGFMKVANEFGKKTKDLTTKAAYIGLSGAKRILFMAYSRIVGSKIKAFETLEEAKEYLVKNDDY